MSESELQLLLSKALEQQLRQRPASCSVCRLPAPLILSTQLSARAFAEAGRIGLSDRLPISEQRDLLVKLENAARRLMVVSLLAPEWQFSASGFLNARRVGAGWCPCAMPTVGAFADKRDPVTDTWPNPPYRPAGRAT